MALNVDTVAFIAATYLFQTVEELPGLPVVGYQQ